MIPRLPPARRGGIDGAGGRGVLIGSNLVFATGLVMLAASPSPLTLPAGWAVMGLGMGAGLYEAGFATLTDIYGNEARGLSGLGHDPSADRAAAECLPAEWHGNSARAR